MDKDIEGLKKLIEESNYIVFFGGAGVSTESGIPDFRSVDGLYNQKYDDPPETILSHSYFIKNPDKFYKFYKEKMLFPNINPNKAHISLAKLEERGKLKAVITQNIDGLHQKAGSKNVLELHGTVWKNYCCKCNKLYSLEEIVKYNGVPTCSCSGIIKPKVVLYEESLDMDIIEKSIEHLRKADLVIVGGTSLNVYPAAGLLNYTRARIVLINKSSTQMDEKAILKITKPIGEVLSQVIE